MAVGDTSYSPSTERCLFQKLGVAIDPVGARGGRRSPAPADPTGIGLLENPQLSALSRGRCCQEQSSEALTSARSFGILPGTLMATKKCISRTLGEFSAFVTRHDLVACEP